MKRWLDIKNKAVALRLRGASYREINKTLKEKTPKSTIFSWCRNVKFSQATKKLIKRRMLQQNKEALSHAHLVNEKRRQEHLNQIYKRNLYLKKVLPSKGVSKIILAVLYLTEGSKVKRGSIMFGNSDPMIINLFLKLLRLCYNPDEAKFRCTVQCRADQDVASLESFWSKLTKIPKRQFYKARIDPRSFGKVSKKPDYKGVCRIDYFSGELFWEFQQVAKIITGR